MTKNYSAQLFVNIVKNIKFQQFTYKLNQILQTYGYR